MTIRCGALIGTVLLACAGCSPQELRPHTKSLLVESPADLPPGGRRGGTDMFLHSTNKGSTYLYVESADGRELSILDVTDPAAIRSAGRATISAAAAFNYVEDVNQLGVLVRYRGNEGYAVLDLSRYDRPSLGQAPQLSRATTAATIADIGLVLTAPAEASTAGAIVPAPASGSGRTYDIMDTSHGGTPLLLASVSGVKRSLSKPDTGTLFLLSDEGVTVVRNLRAEDEHTTEINAAKQ